jgi:hypothetical protein
MTGCRTRIRNTEKYRKDVMKESRQRRLIGGRGGYDDEKPPVRLDNDCEATCGGGGGGKETTSCTCPHYRALTTKRLANMAYRSLRPARAVTAGCSFGGAKTRLGTHDIEDLVVFGRNTEMKNDLALYRKPEEKSMGMAFYDGTTIENLTADGPAARAGLNVGDQLVRAGGCFDVQGTGDVAEQIERLSLGEPLIVSAKHPPSNDVNPNNDEGEEEEEEDKLTTACPYVLSQELARQAEIVFAPYNYILDPGIRSAMQISVENAVIVLDEAHNVEDVLRESGSITVRELEVRTAVERHL